VCELTKEISQSPLVEGAGGEGDHGVVETLIRVGDDPTVDVQKDECGVERGAFVPIDEWLILGKI
jgi:hypothetical protein